MLLFLLKTEAFSFYWKQVKGLRAACILPKLIPAASFTSSPTLHPLTPLQICCLIHKSHSLPQDICTCCVYYLECSSSRYPYGLFSHHFILFNYTAFIVLNTSFGTRQSFNYFIGLKII